MVRPRAGRVQPTIGLLLAALIGGPICVQPEVHSQERQPGQPQPTSQQQPSSQEQTSPAALEASAQAKQPTGQTRNQQTGTSNDRLFWTFPDFLTLENAGQVPPLTTGQKFKVVTRSSFDYFEYPWCGFLAGISQAQNSEPGYGQGAAGYGKRYGAAFADGTIENFMTGAILPSVLRQDPRYYQLGKGGFWRRTGYAISRIFVTRTDSGGEQFDYSEIVGSALSAGISTYSYHPASDRNIRNALSVWGSQVGYDTLTIVMKEFWPDIRQHFSKKRP